MRATEHHEVVIVGGGTAGITVAARLVAGLRRFLGPRRRLQAWRQRAERFPSGW